jgi:hypothetical protein
MSDTTKKLVTIITSMLDVDGVKCRRKDVQQAVEDLNISVEEGLDYENVRDQVREHVQTNIVATSSSPAKNDRREAIEAYIVEHGQDLATNHQVVLDALLSQYTRGRIKKDVAEQMRQDLLARAGLVQTTEETETTQEEVEVSPPAPNPTTDFDF